MAIAAAGGSSFFYPALGAYLPSLAKDERQLGPANSAWASLQNISYIIGPAIGGIVLAVGSVQAAFVIILYSLLFTALDIKDRAFQQLHRAYEIREPGLLFLKVAPWLDPLRSDPRYGTLVEKLGLG